MSEWPDEALEQAVAVWAVLHYKKGIRITARNGKSRQASGVEMSIQAGSRSIRFHRFSDHPTGSQKSKYQGIGMQFAPEAIWRPDGSDAISLFPGPEKKIGSSS